MLKIFRTAIIVALAAFILFPMLYTFSLSFFQGLDFTDSYAHFLPSSFSLRNYILASGDRYFPRYALNSLITAFLTASIRLVITTFSAFTFTHLEDAGYLSGNNTSFPLLRFLSSFHDRRILIL